MFFRDMEQKLVSGEFDLMANPTYVMLTKGEPPGDPEFASELSGIEIDRLGYEKGGKPLVNERVIFGTDCTTLAADDMTWPDCDATVDGLVYYERSPDGPESSRLIGMVRFPAQTSRNGGSITIRFSEGHAVLIYPSRPAAASAA